MSESSKAIELATLGGGCFWCLEAVFTQLRGVNRVESGYAGGHVVNPDYDAVCRGNTGHAEVIRIEFDPDQIRFATLLDVFFTIHDPTTLNRQGSDTGSQYRSVIFTHHDKQHAMAREMMNRLSMEKVWPDPIVTQLLPITHYFPAEDYHQRYFELNGQQPYCQFVVAPKVQKLYQKFGNLLKNAA